MCCMDGVQNVEALIKLCTNESRGELFNILRENTLYIISTIYVYEEPTAPIVVEILKIISVDVDWLRLSSYFPSVNLP